jgi:hypothetical protein
LYGWKGVLYFYHIHELFLILYPEQLLFGKKRHLLLLNPYIFSGCNRENDGCHGYRMYYKNTEGFLGKGEDLEL